LTDISKQPNKKESVLANGLIHNSPSTIANDNNFSLKNNNKNSVINNKSSLKSLLNIEKNQKNSRNENSNALSTLNSEEGSSIYKPINSRTGFSTSLAFNKTFKKKIDYLNYYETRELEFQKALLKIKSSENFLNIKYDSSQCRKDCERFFITNYCKVKSNTAKNEIYENLSKRNKPNMIKIESLQQSVVHSIDNKALEKYNNYLNECKRKDYNKIRKEFQVKSDREIEIKKVIDDRNKQIVTIDKNIDLAGRNSLFKSNEERNKKVTKRKFVLSKLTNNSTEFYKKSPKRNKNVDKLNKELIKFEENFEKNSFVLNELVGLENLDTKDDDDIEKFKRKKFDIFAYQKEGAEKHDDDNVVFTFSKR
jgi:hypothetical protein